MGAIEQLRALTQAGVVERASTMSPSDKLLPVSPAFHQLLPSPGLARGTTTQISGLGATSLALALVALASEDSFIAVVGLPSIGMLSAAGLGVALERLVFVPSPGAHWTGVLAALCDAFDIVIAHSPRFDPSDARKLSARVRDHRTVMIAIGNWPAADVRLTGTATSWFGIGSGHGHLAARIVTVESLGRGSASRMRTADLWLPGDDGRVSLSVDAPVASIRRIG